MRLALDVRVRRGPRSSFVRVSELLEEAAHAAGLAPELWAGGPCAADVLWSPLLGPEEAPRGPLRVRTIHDVSPLLPDPRPAAVRAWRAWRFHRRLRAAAAEADAFAVVSADACARAEAALPALAGRTGVVPHFAAACMRPWSAAAAAPVLARRGLQPGSVLFVAALRRHKNWDGAVRAWAALPSALRARHPLVLAGSDHHVGDAPERLAARLGADPSGVRRLGAVDDALLPALYSSCAVFLFPSWQEGFGLPPLEAMACGAPVIASGVTAMPEVLGDAALYGRPEDPASFVAPLRGLLEDPVARAARSARSLERARAFGPARTGAAMRALLDRLGDQAK